jgi:hypothetical protein
MSAHTHLVYPCLLCVARDHELREYHPGSATVAPRHAELRPAPANRTHANVCAQGLANEQHTAAILNPAPPRVFKKDAPYKYTGVKEQCALRFLPLFDIIWDILPDMMHIIPVLWKGHIFKLFNGTREPSAVKPRKSWTAAANKQLMKDHEEAKRKVAGWALTLVSQCCVWCMCVVCMCVCVWCVCVDVYVWMYMCGAVCRKQAS